MRYLNRYKIFALALKYGIKNYKVVNGLVNVNGNVNLMMMKKLKKLPIKFGEVTGSFRCEYNELVTLEGAPNKVGGGFHCQYNALDTLEGGPSEVGGDFNCSHNQLTTLKGCPSEIGGDFNCYKNDLAILLGGPKEVVGNFECGFNELISLEGAPRKINGSFKCDHNKITTLVGMPDRIGGDFNFSRNPVNDLEGYTSVSGDIRSWDTPIYPIIAIFITDRDDKDSLIELFNDTDIIRGDEIILDRLIWFYEEIGVVGIERINFPLIKKFYKIISD